MSIRQSVNDAIYSALDGSTDVVTVLRTLDEWWELNITDCPAVCLIPGDAEVSRCAFPSTGNDMHAEYPFKLRGYVMLRNTTTRTDEARTTLAVACETAIVSSTALRDLTLDLTVTGISEDEGGLDDKRIGIIDIDCLARWDYNHASP